MNVAAKERSRNREAEGTIEDTAGQIIAARAQLAEVNLVAGRKERRKQIEEWGSKSQNVEGNANTKRRMVLRGKSV
jgi:hypothetical protein